ncbi:MAG: GH25 family lysozyme [Candidatus Limisoma sp.]|nr:GH25 family lysozyme [Bacteroidales bacterium]MDY5893726.1 GH25 family lysozyme [Candidatus Limisoma sp.]MDY5999513.1 GH25 family lysozyme [Candidatus Limisoma sp.]
MTPKKSSRGGKHRALWALGVLLILALLAASLYVLRIRLHHNSSEIVDNDYELVGIDVSSHNGKINFECVSGAGIDFVIIKASEGAAFRDSRFASNYDSAKDNGLAVGAYHFFRFDVDGTLQARNFVETIGDRDFDLPLVIDVEEHGNPYVFLRSKVVRQLRDMVDELTALEYRVMIYTNKDGYYKFIKDNFDDYPLWLCSLNRRPELDWTIWQYSHWGKVDGIQGDVDLNRFYGNLEQWKNWLN